MDDHSLECCWPSCESQEKRLLATSDDLDRMRQQLTREDEQRRIDIALQTKRLKEEHAHHEAQWKLRDTEHKKHAEYSKV